MRRIQYLITSWTSAMAPRFSPSFAPTFYSETPTGVLWSPKPWKEIFPKPSVPGIYKQEGSERTRQTGNMLSSHLPLCLDFHLLKFLIQIKHGDGACPAHSGAITSPWLVPLTAGWKRLPTLMGIDGMIEASFDKRVYHWRVCSSVVSPFKQ